MLDVPLKWVSLKTAFLVTVALVGRSNITKLGYMNSHMQFDRHHVCP